MKIFCPGPLEIGTPSTLRVSHGTKFFGLKNFSYDVVLILFYEIFLVVSQNLKFCNENISFELNDVTIGMRRQNFRYYEISNVG